MIPVGIDYPLYPAFNVRRQVGQYGRSGPALRKRFTVDRPVLRMRRKEKPVGDFLLPISHDVQDGGQAFLQAPEHVAVALDRRHEEGRLEGRLRYPGDGRRAITIFAPRRQHVHAVREHAERISSRPGIHIATPPGILLTKPASRHHVRRRVSAGP